MEQEKLTDWRFWYGFIEIHSSYITTGAILNAILLLSRHSHAQSISSTDCNGWRHIKFCCHGEQFVVTTEIIKNLLFAIVIL